MVHSTRPLIGGFVVPWRLLAESAIGHPGSGIVVTSAGREGQSPRRDRLGCRGRACGVNQDTSQIRAGDDLVAEEHVWADCN